MAYYNALWEKPTTKQVLTTFSTSPRLYNCCLPLHVGITNFTHCIFYLPLTLYRFKDEIVAQL